MKGIDKVAQMGTELVLHPLEDRASTPFGRAYMFSWIVCNYKPLIVIFNLEGYKERLFWLSDLMPSDFHGYAGMFGLPFLLAVLYLLFSPSSEIVVRMGVRAADWGLRVFNAWTSRNDWHSAEEVDGLKKAYQSKIDEGINSIAALKRLVEEEKAVSVENLKKYRSLLDMHIALCASSKYGGNYLDIDPDGTGVRGQFPRREPYDFERGLPEEFVYTMVTLLSLPGDDWRYTWMLGERNTAPFKCIGYGVRNGILKLEIDRACCASLQLTPLGLALMEACRDKFPTKSFVSEWNAYKLNSERANLLN